LSRMRGAARPRARAVVRAEGDEDEDEGDWKVTGPSPTSLRLFHPHRTGPGHLAVEFTDAGVVPVLP